MRVCLQLTTTTREEESRVLSWEGEEISVTPDMAGVLVESMLFVAARTRKEAQITSVIDSGGRGGVQLRA